MACLAEKCFLNSSSVMEGGKPLMKMRDDSIVSAMMPSAMRGVGDFRSRVLLFSQAWRACEINQEARGEKI